MSSSLVNVIERRRLTLRLISLIIVDTATTKNNVQELHEVEENA